MTYVKINDTLYPALISGRTVDRDWNNRASKAITLEMSHTDAMALFVDNLEWFIVYEVDEVTEIYDNTEYSVAGSITDNRDGTVTVRMGKPTDAEILAVIMGG